MMGAGDNAALEHIRREMPWVIRAKHDPLRHVVRLYDKSGDYRAFSCASVWEALAKASA